MSLKIKEPRHASARKLAAIEEAIKEEVINLNMRIPRSLHRRLRLQAVEEGHNVKMKSIVVKAIEQYLNGQSANDGVH